MEDDEAWLYGDEQSAEPSAEAEKETDVSIMPTFDIGINYIKETQNLIWSYLS